jgi:5'(3')-deoxyribonucleotidase
MNKKLTIALDLDDTISIFMPTCIKTYNEIYGTNHSIEEVNTWYVDGIFKHSLWSIFDKCDVLQRMPLKEGAFDTIKKWHEQGHKLVIVTGVHDVKSYLDKIKWLERTGLDKYILDIIPTQNKELINADVLVDDNPEYLRKWVKTNPESLPLLMTAQHNKGKDYSDEFIRVTHWHEIDLLLELLTRKY